MVRRDLTGKYARWAEKLAELASGLEFEHCPGSKNTVADALSRVVSASSRLSPARDSSLNLLSSPESTVSGDSVHQDVVALVAFNVSPPGRRVISCEELSKRQRSDAALEEVVTALEDGSSGLAPHRLSDFRLDKGILYRRGSGGGRGWRLVVPRCLRYDVLRSCHEDPTSGHEGQEKTLKRLEARFWWSGVRRHVRKYVSGCMFCQMRKTPRTLPTGAMELGPTPTEPFMCWGVDHLGPFPITACGNKYIVVVIDYFSKWTIAGALPDAKAETAIEFFLDRVVNQFGVPLQVVTDQGSAFTSQSWSEMVGRLNIRHTLATAEHQQTNGLVEKANGTLVDRVAAFVLDHLDSWDKLLGSAVFAINSSIQSSINVSPFQVVFGMVP